jgi:hypothetical protein
MFCCGWTCGFKPRISVEMCIFGLFITQNTRP